MPNGSDCRLIDLLHERAIAPSPLVGPPNDTVSRLIRRRRPRYDRYLNRTPTDLRRTFPGKKTMPDEVHVYVVEFGDRPNFD